MEVAYHCASDLGNALVASEDVSGVFCSRLLVHHLVAQGQVVGGCSSLHLLGTDAVGVVGVGAYSYTVLLDLCQAIGQVVGVNAGIATLHLSDQVTSGVPGVGGTGALGKVRLCCCRCKQ